jgi:hypothetical protein
MVRLNVMGERPIHKELIWKLKFQRFYRQMF